MKTIIAGSRDFGIKHFSNYRTCLDTFESTMNEIPWNITQVLSGGARGADTLGEMWASSNSVPLTRYPAQWTSFGKAAGYIRNEEMAKNAEALIAFWDGESKGTKHMIDTAKKRGLTIHVMRTDQEVTNEQ